MRSLTLDIDPLKPMPVYPGKSCAGCDACCSTVPVKEIGLQAFHRCQHLRSLPDMRIGCSIYRTRPHSCGQWACGWLIADLPDKYKPNRIGIVLDPMPDIVRINGKELAASQVWVVPGHEEDWQKPPIQDLLFSCFDLGLAVLWRVKAEDGGQAARVMFSQQKGHWTVGPLERSDAEMPGFKSDGERYVHAQQLLERK